MSFRMPLACLGEPYIELMLWSAFLLFLPILGSPTVHVVGINGQTGRARVSSPVVKVHTSGQRVITQSGRLYGLLGAPGAPAYGKALLADWATAWDALVLDNVTPTLMSWPGRGDVASAAVSAAVH